MINVYVNYQDKSPNFSTLGEAVNYISQNYLSDRERLYTSDENIEAVNIYIAPGVYRELLVIERPYVTLRGENAENTVIVYNNCALGLMSDGNRRGTFHTATMRISTHNVCVENLTIQNDAGHRHKAAQAIAAYVDGDEIEFYRCRFLGCTDTLFTAPLPDKTIKGLEFYAPESDMARVVGRQYYKECYIKGDLDFIFGSATAYFEKCEIFSIMPEQIPDEKKNGETIYGYITAASTPQGEAFGYVFKECRLTGECPENSVMLGRPWRECAKTVFLNCYMGEHIHSDGWSEWGKTTGSFYYGEYCSYGPGTSYDSRVKYSHQLTDEEAGAYSIEKVFRGWIPSVMYK